MKIITWNCNGAFRKKFDSLLRFNADIYIIQECENPLLSNDIAYQSFASNHIWIGDTKNKGIGIFAKPNIVIEKLNWVEEYDNHKVKYFLPCSINNKIDILAVWTHQNNSPTFGYIGQFWKYLQVNKKSIKNTIVIGDFNSNVIWDKWDRWWNHSNVVAELEELGIESIYHKITKEQQGKETQPTFYLHRKLEKPYHIDYCFVPKKITDNFKNITIEKFENWMHLSDHIPIVVEFDME